MNRTLRQIASEIASDWKNVNFAARPYLEAMFHLDTIYDNFCYDSGREIVLRFLCNASTWRGEKARAIKKELKKLAGIR